MNDSDAPKNNIAVALDYDSNSQDAPRVIAKGYGEVAEKIVALAKENNIVIEANPHLAEALSGVEIDQTIPVELYQAVAEVIGFVLKVQNKMK